MGCLFDIILCTGQSLVILVPDDGDRGSAWNVSFIPY